MLKKGSSFQDIIRSVDIHDFKQSTIPRTNYRKELTDLITQIAI